MSGNDQVWPGFLAGNVKKDQLGLHDPLILFPEAKVETRSVFHTSCLPTLKSFHLEQNLFIYKWIHTLASKTNITNANHHELDIIDSDLTCILVKADQKCIKFGNYPWSPQLHEAYLVHNYWSLKLSQKRTGQNYPQAFQAIGTRVPHQKLYQPHLNSLSAHLQFAQRQLQTIHQEAKDKWKDHLNKLIAAGVICKDQKWKKLILSLKQAEELRSCYMMVHSIMKPRQPGGISHVWIPTINTQNETQRESTYDPQALEHLVLQQHWQHFSQANGTVMTQEPLWALVNNECTSEYAHQILAGTVDITSLPVDEYTKDLLQQLKSKVLPSKNTQHPLDKDTLIKGFKMWPKKTSTSPSGWHLGIYKSLAKHFPPPKDKDNQETPPEPIDPLQCGNDVLTLLIMMMELVINHTHTYKRWKTVWTLLLEKDQGNPQIDHLRTIHLYEANYNLLLKWFSSKGFILQSKTKHRINDNQGRGWPGRSTIDLAITKVLSYEVADTLWLRVIIVDNDATACFDWMIKAPNNLACLQHGAPKVYPTPCPNTTRTPLLLETQIQNLHRIQYQ